MGNIKIKCDLNFIAIFLIIFSEICLYTAKTISLYRFLTFFGMGVIIFKNLSKFSLKIRMDNLVIWFTLIYSLFVFYIIFFLKIDNSPIETIVIRYFECVSLYIGLKSIYNSDKNVFVNLFIIISIFCVGFFLLREGKNIINGGSRFGNELSNNVNTVGFCFGFLSIIVFWSYYDNKNIFKLLLFVLLSIVMLLTGSKKALVILIINLVMFLILDRRKLSKWIKFLIIFLLIYYVIFNIPYFYQIIGRRVENMFMTLTNNTSNVYYSESTEDRGLMIREGLILFLKHPIFGGGWGYYAANTLLGYNYSHNNYVELLCSFGIFGLLLFYSAYIKRIIYCIRKILNKIADSNKYRWIVLAFTYLITALILDIGTVSFSAQCIFYIPIIISSIIIENNIRGENDEKKECNI